MQNEPLIRAIQLCGGQSGLARASGYTQAHVWYWLNKAKRVPAEAAPKIEEATGGKVTRAQLRPDLFAQATE